MKVCVLAMRGPDGDYTAVCPTLPGCTSNGKTMSEVLSVHRKTVMERLNQMEMTPDKLTFRVVRG